MSAGLFYGKIYMDECQSRRDGEKEKDPQIELICFHFRGRASHTQSDSSSAKEPNPSGNRKRFKKNMIITGFSNIPQDK